MLDEATGGMATQSAGLGPISAETLARCYAEMRQMAQRILANNYLGYVLQPTELANESAIRLIRSGLSKVNNEGHLLAIAARSMRQILVSEVRKANAAKRDAAALLTAWPEAGEATPVSLTEIDEALRALASISPRRAEIVELRFMLGMTVDETAAATGIPARSVKRHWQAARAWLLARLQDDGCA